MATVTLTIDGREVTVEKGATILKAAQKLRIPIPHYCYHPALPIAGSCRMCFVEVEKMPKLVTACSTVAGDEMVVSTDNENVQRGRKGVMEFLLINHPLDCPECDQAGECHLQNYSFKYGDSHSRFREDKRDRPPKDLGPTIKLYTNRCIMCTRCVRFGREIDGFEELGVFQRGSHAQINTYPDKPLQNKLAGNVVDICPVGALIDKNFLHKARVWNLTRTPSVCPGCSSGCNLFVDTLDNRIQRLKPRFNGDVNGHWICDDGRYSYHAWENIERLEQPMVRDNGELKAGTWDDALAAVKANCERIHGVHGADSMAAIGSATATNEENYLLATLFRGHFETSQLGLLHTNSNGEAESFKSGFTIEADKNWNARGGAEMLELSGDADSVEPILAGINEGRIKALYILRKDNRDDLPDAWLETLGKLELLIVQDVTPSKLSAMAHVVLPGANAWESEGTVTNSAGRVQRVAAAQFPPGLALQGWDVVSRVLAKFTGGESYIGANAVFNEMTGVRAAYQGMTFYGLGESGASLDQQATEATT